jgi:uncharacterized protein
MLNPEVLKGLFAGAIAGLASGFLGVSPGGILVAVISLLLPYGQHVVQGISLLAQAPPTGLSGVKAYSKNGRRVALGEILIVAMGFILGGPVGAAFARQRTDNELRWIYVGYLVLLAALAAFKRPAAGEATSNRQPLERLSMIALFLIGVIAGASSGLLGIGGGVAITALCILVLHKDQHQAQALSLAITALPLTLPAAWVYIRQGWHLPWPVIFWLVAGLALGTWMGAAFANRLPEKKLKFAFVGLLLVMAGYMAAIASRS